MLSASTLQAQTEQNFTVFIDPGHGGKDPGNMHNGYVEKKITLAIALKLGKLLARKKVLRCIIRVRTIVR